MREHLLGVAFFVCWFGGAVFFLVQEDKDVIAHYPATHTFLQGHDNHKPTMKDVPYNRWAPEVNFRVRANANEKAITYCWGMTTRVTLFPKDGQLWAKRKNTIATRMGMAMSTNESLATTSELGIYNQIFPASS